MDSSNESSTGIRRKDATSPSDVPQPPPGEDEPQPHGSLESLTPAHYNDLRRRAGKLLRSERRSHTLSPTALVNEAFLRLSRQRKRVWDQADGFLSAAVVMMRRVLSNYGRDRKALKRGGGQVRVHFDCCEPSAESGGPETDAVRQAMRKLSERDPHMADVIRLKIYRGLTCRTIAELLGSSERTIEREWAAGRAWLRAELSKEEEA